MTLEEEIKLDFEKIKKKEDQLDKQVDEIQKSIKLFSIWAWAFVGAGLIITVFGITILFFFPKSELKLPEYGSFVGGSAASFWSLAGLFFIYIAFLGQKQQLLLQQLEIKFSQLELKSTRLELEGQKNQMIEQNSTLRQQRFENTFFQLISIHTEIVSNMDLRKIGDKTQVIAEGRDCFNNFYKILKGKITSPETATIENTILGYNLFFNSNQNDLGHYFRNLYHIIKFIDKSDIEEKKTYTNFVRAQLSSHELALIFYNGLANYGSEKFKPLIEKYAIVKNMNTDLIFNHVHLTEYTENAYGK